MIPDPDVLCVDSCGRPATDERLTGVIPDGRGNVTEMVELVCTECARRNP